MLVAVVVDGEKDIEVHLEGSGVGPCCFGIQTGCGVLVVVNEVFVLVKAIQTCLWWVTEDVVLLCRVV